MRHRMLGLVRSFGTQSDKDFFFHNLAKTGEVACKGFNCVLLCHHRVEIFLKRMYIIWRNSAYLAPFFGLPPGPLLTLSTANAIVTRVSIPGLFTASHCFSKRGHAAPFLCSALLANSDTFPQVLILYRDIIRTARVMTHKDNGTAHAPRRRAARHVIALTFDADGVPWSLKLISHARAEIEDARALRDSEVAMSLGGLSCALCR